MDRPGLGPGLLAPRPFSLNATLGVQLFRSLASHCTGGQLHLVIQQGNSASPSEGPRAHAHGHVGRSLHQRHSDLRLRLAICWPGGHSLQPGSCRCAWRERGPGREGLGLRGLASPGPVVNNSGRSSSGFSAPGAEPRTQGFQKAQQEARADKTPQPSCGARLSLSTSQKGSDFLRKINIKMLALGSARTAFHPQGGKNVPQTSPQVGLSAPSRVHTLVLTNCLHRHTHAPDTAPAHDPSGRLQAQWAGTIQKPQSQARS